MPLNITKVKSAGSLDVILTLANYSVQIVPTCSIPPLGGGGGGSLDSPTNFRGTSISVNSHALSWFDSVDATSYEIRYNLTGAPVTASDSLAGIGIVGPGIEYYDWVLPAGAQSPTTNEVFYGICAINASGASSFAQTSVINMAP